MKATKDQKAVKNPISFDLGVRLKKLPIGVVEEIRKDFFTLYGSTRMRWSILLDNNTNYMKSTEAEIFMKHIGCSISQLHDADYDLMDSYLSLKADQENSQARKYGLVK